MDKDVVYTHNRILLSQKKKEIMPLAATGMDLVSDYHTERNKSDRERQISYDITGVESLMIQMNLFTKQTHRHRKQT